MIPSCTFDFCVIRFSSVATDKMLDTSIGHTDTHGFAQNTGGKKSHGEIQDVYAFAGYFEYKPTMKLLNVSKNEVYYR